MSTPDHETGPAGSVPLTVTSHGDVVVLAIDDGKANVFTHPLLEALGAALDEAESEARAVLLTGREGMLSGGFDLGEMTAGAQRAYDLVTAGARFHLRLFTFPVPVVVAATGHAVAAGAICLLAADHTVGARGPFRIGLPETAIGMPLPRFAVDLARARLAPAAFRHATGLGRMYDPDGAAAIGYLDTVVDGDATEAALGEASRLAETIHPAAFALTRERTHRPLAEAMLSDLERDIGALTLGGGRPG